LYDDECDGICRGKKPHKKKVSVKKNQHDKKKKNNVIILQIIKIK
jgi:hypothetical protein